MSCPWGAAAAAACKCHWYLSPELGCKQQQQQHSSGGAAVAGCHSVYSTTAATCQSPPTTGHCNQTCRHTPAAAQLAVRCPHLVKVGPYAPHCLVVGLPVHASQVCNGHAQPTLALLVLASSPQLAVCRYTTPDQSTAMSEGPCNASRRSSYDMSMNDGKY